MFEKLKEILHKRKVKKQNRKATKLLKKLGSLKEISEYTIPANREGVRNIIIRRRSE